MSETRRVVVTGMGVISPSGMSLNELWENLLAGKTAINTIRNMDTSEFKTTVGAEIDNVRLADAMASVDLRPFDRTVDMGLLASHAALTNAGLLTHPGPRPPMPIAVILGTGGGSTHSVDNAHAQFSEKGIRGVRPTTVPRCMSNAVSAQVSLRFKLTGPNYVIVSACSSSTCAIGTAFRMVKDGYADKVLCGGAEAIFSSRTFTSWNNLGVMSKNPDPLTACRPFDVNRDGCVLGEGAATLVLESEESAATRNAPISAEICGYGESSDAEHITHPSVEGQARAIRAAMESASVSPVDIGFVNAHGTATQANDECESQSIRTALGDCADTVPVASSKSFFGHLLGAAGAMETVVTILGLNNRKVPPNLNLETPGPRCDLNYVGPTALDISTPIAIKNSFAFGGNNTVLVIRRRDS